MARHMSAQLATRDRCQPEAINGMRSMDALLCLWCSGGCRGSRTSGREAVGYESPDDEPDGHHERATEHGVLAGREDRVRAVQHRYGGDRHVEPVLALL